MVMACPPSAFTSPQQGKTNFLTAQTPFQLEQQVFLILGANHFLLFINYFCKQIPPFCS